MPLLIKLGKCRLEEDLSARYVELMVLLEEMLGEACEDMLTQPTEEVMARTCVLELPRFSREELLRHLPHLRNLEWLVGGN